MGGSGNNVKKDELVVDMVFKAKYSGIYYHLLDMEAVEVLMVKALMVPTIIVPLPPETHQELLVSEAEQMAVERVVLHWTGGGFVRVRLHALHLRSDTCRLSMEC